MNNDAPLLLLLVRVVPPELTVSAPLTVSAEVVLFSVIPVTLVPTAALMVIPPVPVPEFVIVPELFTATVVRLVPPAVALLLFNMRLPVPVTPPDNTNVFVALVFVNVVPPELTFSAPVILKAEVELLSSMLETLLPTLVLISVLPAPVPELVMEPVLLTELVDSVMPPAVALLLFSTRLPDPLTPPDKVNPAVLPLVMVVPLALVVSKPLTVIAEVALFSVMAVTFASTLALISAVPELVPELVTVPVMFTSFVESVMPLAAELLFLRVRFPLPLMPPDIVNNAVLLFISVVPPEFMLNAPLTFNAEVVLFSVIPVTLEPTPALIEVVPEPAPILVIVPILLSALVESVTVPVVPLLLIVRLLVPVTPPLKVVEMAAPEFPSVSVPVVVEASAIAFANVKPVVLINSDAALLPPALLPSVTVPVPRALAEVEPIIVPAVMVVPPEYVLTPDSVSPDVVLF